MIKIFSPSGWDFDRPIAMPIKIGTRGLIGNDRTEFLKTASHIFLPIIDGIKFAADEEPVHLIALGAYEAYGSNRNGDAFKEAACKKYHDTFVKHAHWHRNHKNKVHDGDPFYGIVKHSAYNDPMRRIELLCLLNREKSAADRNGGHVADRELEKLAKGEDIPVSMACRVPFDECLFCHNQASTRDNYCTQEKCAAGGCKDNLTRLVKMGNDVFVLGVDNPDPTWFDISHVWRPADRIAYGNKADYLFKEAADKGGFLGIGGAKTAEDLGVTAPLSLAITDAYLLPQHHKAAVVEMLKLAQGISELEMNVDQFGKTEQLKRAFDSAVQTPLDITPLGTPGTTKSAEALAALADQKIVMALRDFARWTSREALAEKAASAMQGVYRRMFSDGSIGSRFENNPYSVAPNACSPASRRWALLQKTALSLEKSALDYRCKLSSIRNYSLPRTTDVFTEKQASDQPDVEKLARDYAIYKVAALQRIAATDTDFLLTVLAAIRQNYVV